MSTNVRLPDGRTIVVQTDDPKQAAAAARKYVQSQNKPSNLDGFMGHVANSLLPNWADDLRGVGDGIKAKLNGQDFGPAYRAGAAKFRQDDADWSRQHPTASKIAAAGGMALGMAVPVSRAAEGATLVGRAAQGARVGAAYGGAAGAGEGDSITERGSNALYGAANGAVVGAAIPGVGEGAQAAGRWARRNMPGVDLVARGLSAVPRAVINRSRPVPLPSAAEAQGNRMLARHMNRGNISGPDGRPAAPATPQGIAQEVQDRNAMGVPAMVGDVTPNMRQITEYSSRGSGPGQDIVRRALDDRKALEGQRVRQHVQNTMPTTTDPIRYVEDQKAAASAKAGPLYDQAYQQPVFRNQAIQGIEHTPAFREALPQAYRNIQNQIDQATGLPKDPTAMGFRDMGNVNPNGLPPNYPAFQAHDGRWIAYDRGLSTEGYDQVARTMDTAARNASEVNPLTGAVRMNSNSVHVAGRGKDLRQELMSQNDPYRRAVQGYGDDMTHARAFEQGNDFGRLNGHEVSAQGRAMPDTAHPTWTTGAGTQMADAASQYGATYPTGDVGNHVRKMLGDPIKQQAVDQMAGAPVTSDLLPRLEYEHQGHLNWKGVNGNSATAHRQQLDADLSDEAGIPTSHGGIVKGLISYMVTRAAPKFQQDLKEHLAKVVTMHGATDIASALKAIDAQAAGDAHFAHLLHKSGIAATAAFGDNIQPVYDDTQDAQ